MSSGAAPARLAPARIAARNAAVGLPRPSPPIRRRHAVADSLALPSAVAAHLGVCTIPLFRVRIRASRCPGSGPMYDCPCHWRARGRPTGPHVVQSPGSGASAVSLDIPPSRPVVQSPESGASAASLADASGTGLPQRPRLRAPLQRPRLRFRPIPILRGGRRNGLRDKRAALWLEAHGQRGKRRQERRLRHGRP